MRKSILSLVSLFAITCVAPIAYGQQKVTETHQVGLIDMAHVFKNYEKFKSQTQALQDEIVAGDTELKAKVEDGKRLQEQMKELTVGSAEFEKLEGDILSLQADIKKIQLKKQRELMKKEADLYKAVYLEVYEAVNRYARYYKYTLVMRFDREGLAAATDPQEIVSGLNQQVLYHRNRDDLTDPILNYLNEQWRRQNQTATAPATGTNR